MKIIITGAIGHIGSFIIRDLAVQFPRAKIVMIDNMMTKRYSSLFNLPTIGDYSFIEDDVKNMELNHLLDDNDVVVHLAAITDAAGSFNNATIVEENNYQSTVNVVNACVESGAKLIAVSSTSVYGTQNNVVDENCSNNELQPQSPYATTKLREESYVKRMIKDRGLNAIHCRFGTIFGASAGIRFHTAVNKFCWQAVMSQPITVWSTAYEQKRPYLDLIDASRAILFIIQNDIFDGRIYNVLTQNSTVHEVVDVISEFIPKIKIEFVDNEIMNQLSYEVLDERFKSTGFIPTGSLRRGIGETITLLRNSNSHINL